MPGPVSDSYSGPGDDWTRDIDKADGAEVVANGIRDVSHRITEDIGSRLVFIVDVVRGEPGAMSDLKFTERELRIIRFCLNRVSEEL